MLTFRIDNMVITNFLGARSFGYGVLQEEIAKGNGFPIEKATGEEYYSLSPTKPNGYRRECDFFCTLELHVEKSHQKQYGV